MKKNRKSDLPPKYEIHVDGEFDADYTRKQAAFGDLEALRKRYPTIYTKDSARIYKVYYKDVTP